MAKKYQRRTEAEILHQLKPIKASRNYRCCECDGIIVTGWKYFSIWTRKYHPHCAMLKVKRWRGMVTIWHGSALAAGFDMAFNTISKSIAEQDKGTLV